MMKKLSIGLLFWLCFSSLHAFTIDEIPDEFYVSQHWVSYTTGFDIETKTQKLGTLYRRASAYLAYDLYDPFSQNLASARARFSSQGAYFDVTDYAGQLLGTVEEQIYTYFPSFTIYANGVHKAARTEMNFWGTSFTVSDVITGQEIAVMSRPFFRSKNDWTINISNRKLLKDRNIDAKLFLIVIAFQCDQEYWQQQDKNNSLRKNTVGQDTPVHKVQNSGQQDLQKTIQALSTNEDLNQVNLLSETELEAITKQLDTDYQAYVKAHENNDTNSVGKLDDFMSFCRERMQSNLTPLSEKKAILYLLKTRVGIA